MFWKRREAAQDSRAPKAMVVPPSPEVQELRDELDASLETAADILRARARYAFSVAHEDAPSIAMAFDQWASHLLVRSPPPASAINKNPNLAPGKRDYRALIDFVTSHSRREQEWVETSTRDMREAILALVESFRRSSSAQGRQDDLLRRRLTCLHNALESGSAEGLKREARAVASAVSQVMEEQRIMAELQAKELRTQLTALGEQLEQTRREGETDPLTRVANRRAFDVALPQSLAVGSVLGRPVTLMMIDIDHFKSINDTHGHVVGDEVLRAVADALARAFPRRSDLVVRYGGEEFALLLSDTGAEQSKMLSDRLLSTIRALRVQTSGKTLAVTVSVGVAIAHPLEAPNELVQRADRALYAAKHGGRNRAVIAEPPAICCEDGK